MQTLGRHFGHLVLLLNSLPVNNAGLYEVHQLGGRSKKLDKVKSAKSIKKVFTGKINIKENDKDIQKETFGEKKYLEKYWFFRFYLEYDQSIAEV